MKNRKLYGILTVIFVLIVIGGLIFFLFRKPKEETPSTEEASIEETTSEKLESYDEDKEDDRLKITELQIDDQTDSFTDSEIEDITESLNQFANEFFSVLYTYDENTQNFTQSLEQYFADVNEYPTCGIQFCADAEEFYKIVNLRSTYDSVNIVTENIRERDDTRCVVAIRGCIRAKFSTKTTEMGTYDTVFRSSMIRENGEWKVLEMVPAKYYEQGVEAYWLDENQITVQFSGHFVGNWEIGALDEFYEGEE